MKEKEYTTVWKRENTNNQCVCACVWEREKQSVYEREITKINMGNREYKSVCKWDRYRRNKNKRVKEKMGEHVGKEHLENGKREREKHIWEVNPIISENLVCHNDQQSNLCYKCYNQ